MRKEPPTESTSFPTPSPFHPGFPPHGPSPPGSVTNPTQFVAVIPAARHFGCPLTMAPSQTPQPCYDSQSKFDFSSHLRSTISAICLILYLNSSSGHEGPCLGKGRGTVREKLL